MTKEEIIIATEKISTQLSQTCNAISEAVFFEWPEDKWSVADNIKHLILSINTTTLAYKLPKFFVRLIGGKPNRISRSYDEVLAKYYKKLEEGGKASSRYVPIRHKPNTGNQILAKKILLDRWNKYNQNFISALTNNRTENDLDNYLIKHPLLGKITLRELCYFTIFHTEHHLNSILKRTSTQA